MGTDWGDAQRKDWGGSEVHDWDLPSPPPSDSTLLIPDEPLVTVEDPTTDAELVEADSSGADKIRSTVVMAMNNWKHSSLTTESEADGPTEFVFGSGDSTVYAIENGRDHAMIGRAVGQDAAGCVYCLVGRVPVGDIQELGETHPEAAFNNARDISLSSVFQDDQVKNVVLIQHYNRVDDVPIEYRPPSPFLMFTDQ